MNNQALPKSDMERTPDSCCPKDEPEQAGSSAREQARRRGWRLLSSPLCTACDGGYLIAPDGTPSYCSCLDGQRVRRLDEEMRQTLLENRQRVLARCFADYPDSELLSWSLESYPLEGDQAALATIRRFVEHWDGKRGLLLIGPTYGSGKTGLMVGLIKELLPRIATLERATKLGNWSARFITMVKLLDELKAGMDEQQERMITYSQVLLEHRDAYLLALDDLGVEKLTPFVANVFYALLDERGKRGLPTLLTSNLGLKALEAHLTPRVFSRLLYMVDTLEVTGPDLRLLAAARRVRGAH